MADNDTDKWERARTIAARAEQVQGQYDHYLEASALAARFADATERQVIEMFERGVNDKGRPLNSFEFRALCERWCALFGELPPLEPAPPAAGADPIPPDDAMLSMVDVVRITGLSESTIKRRLSDPASDFPRPQKLSPRRMGWPAHLIKNWRETRPER